MLQALRLGAGESTCGMARYSLVCTANAVIIPAIKTMTKTMVPMTRGACMMRYLAVRCAGGI
jgi:hypothetical protein